MNHPPKKKHKNPLLPDDNQVDERNLIDLKDSANLSFEDRVNIYWKENRSFLIACIFILLLILVGYQSMRIVKEQREAALQNEYSEADAKGTLAEFAQAHSNKVLGGFAALKIADPAYTYENYEKAVEFYDIAASVLEEPILAGRARIGQAFALYRSGNPEEGLARLSAVAADTTIAEAIRAEAAYHLAVEAYTAGRMDEFDSYAAQINDSKFAGMWQQRLLPLPVVQTTDDSLPAVP